MRLNNLTDLFVAAVLTFIGVYLIIYGVQQIGEQVSMGEVTVKTTCMSLMLLVFPVTGLVLVASSIIVLIR